MLVWLFICFCAHTFREVMISSCVFNNSVTYYTKQIIFIKSQRKTRGEEGEIKFGESVNRWNSGCKCVAVLHHPSLQQHVRETAKKAICLHKTGAEMTWQPGEECCQSNFWTSTAECSSAERPTTVHPAAPPSAIAAFSSRAELGPEKSLPYH